MTHPTLQCDSPRSRLTVRCLLHSPKINPPPTSCIPFCSPLVFAFFSPSLSSTENYHGVAMPFSTCLLESCCLEDFVRSGPSAILFSPRGRSDFFDVARCSTLASYEGRPSTPVFNGLSLSSSQIRSGGAFFLFRACCGRSPFLFPIPYRRACSKVFYLFFPFGPLLTFSFCIFIAQPSLLFFFLIRF